MTLDDIALKHGTDKASSHHDYCRIYQRYFEVLRDQPINLLEIGVQFGLSLKTWAEYFHRGEIYGVDLLHDFQTDNPHVHLYLGDQANRVFLSTLAPGVLFDVIVDDGGHKAKPQEESFYALWERLKPGGYYVIEDCFTWWDRAFNLPGVPPLVNELVGDVNQNGQVYHGKPHPAANLSLSELETDIDYLHFYRGLMILKRK